MRSNRLLSPLAVLAACFAGTASGQVPSDPDVFMVGHSLVNFTMPQMLRSLVEASDRTGTVEVQVMNGASILANWENPNSAQGIPYTTALASGKHEALVLTEAVPLLNHTTWSNTYQAASDFLAFARRQRPDIRLYIYETWHCINTGRTDTIIPDIAPKRCWYDNDDSLLWQPRIVDDHPKWTKIVDSVKTLQSYPHVFLIPAGSAFSDLAQEIQAGRVPGIGTFRDLFDDDIHPNRLGNWFVANVMFAALHGRSPEGLARVIDDEYGNRLLEVPAALATKLQQVAWGSVCSEPLSGVSCSASGAGRRDRQRLGSLSSTRLFDVRGRVLASPAGLVRRINASEAPTVAP